MSDSMCGTTNPNTKCVRWNVRENKSKCSMCQMKCKATTNVNAKYIMQQSLDEKEKFISNHYLKSRFL